MVAIGLPSQKTDYPTPKELLIAVQAMWGPIGLDCAANKSNHVAPKWLGPGGLKRNALEASWGNITSVPNTALRWLNPPYDDISSWAAKCVRESSWHGTRIAMLVPANVSTNWFWNLVMPFAQPLVLYPPKIEFKGMKNPLPQGMLLCLYGMGNSGKMIRWTWRETKQVGPKVGTKYRTKKVLETYKRLT